MQWRHYLEYTLLQHTLKALNKNLCRFNDCTVVRVARGISTILFLLCSVKISRVNANKDVILLIIELSTTTGFFVLATNEGPPSMIPRISTGSFVRVRTRVLSRSFKLKRAITPGRIYFQLVYDYLSLRFLPLFLLLSHLFSSVVDAPPFIYHWILEIDSLCVLYITLVHNSRYTRMFVSITMSDEIFWKILLRIYIKHDTNKFSVICGFVSFIFLIRLNGVYL